LSAAATTIASGGCRTAAVRRRGELLEIRRHCAARWGEELIDLSRSEPIAAWPGTSEPCDVWAMTRRYPPIAGLPAARAAVARAYAQQLGCELTEHDVVLVPGALAGITVALLALVDGGEVLVPVPCYPPSLAQVELAGAVPLAIDTEPTGWRLTPEAVERARGPRTRALLLSNPANPTGVVYTAGELRQLAAAAGPEVLLIADEVYGEFAYDGPAASLAGVLGRERDAWLVVRSASKTIGRPGLRVGALLGPRDLLAQVAAVAASFVGGVSVPAQLAFSAALPAVRGSDHMRPYRRRREQVLARLAAIGFEAHAPQGTYYVWAGGPPGMRLGTSAGVRELADRAGVIVAPGEHYCGSSRHLRISLSVRAAELAAGLDRLAAA